MSVSFEPVIFINGLSQAAAGVVSLLLALKLKQEKRCMLEKPFYLLAISFFVMSLLNILWATGMIQISNMDSMFVLPFFHLAILAVWFYVGIVMSGHDNVLWLIPIFIMSINGLLLFKSLAMISDIITGLMLVGVFFYIGFVNRKMIKHISLAGMVYGFSIIGAALLAHIGGTRHIDSFWFIPSAIMFYLVFCMLNEENICNVKSSTHKHHIPIIVESIKLGLFVIGLSVFLMLGTLGVHELGHSLAANAMGCSHETSFGIGFAKTHIVCESDAGTTLITLAGLIMTLIVAALLYFMGNDFARRIALLIIAFSFITAVEDFGALGLPQSLFVIVIFISAVLICYGLVLVVRNYEKEYEAHEDVARMCGQDYCEEKNI